MSIFSEDTNLTRLVMICGWERFSLEKDVEEFNPNDNLISLTNLQNRQEKIILFNGKFSELAKILHELPDLINELNIILFLIKVN